MKLLMHKKESKILQTVIFHNILRLLDVLPNFPFPQVKRSTIISNKAELPNDLRLTISGN